MRLKKNKIGNIATSKTPRKIFLVFFYFSCKKLASIKPISYLWVSLALNQTT